MALFQLGDFTSSAGLDLPYKIECDALTPGDWEAVAAMIGCKLRFSSVEGVPTGGFKLAKALEIYADEGKSSVPLICDDVLTTGASMNRQRGNRVAIGVVLFSRGPCPGWVYPVWQLAPWAM